MLTWLSWLPPKQNTESLILEINIPTCPLQLSGCPRQNMTISPSWGSVIISPTLSQLLAVAFPLLSKPAFIAHQLMKIEHHEVSSLMKSNPASDIYSKIRE